LHYFGPNYSHFHVLGGGQCEWASGLHNNAVDTSDSYKDGPMGTHWSTLEPLELFVQQLISFDDETEAYPDQAIDYLAYFASGFASQHDESPSVYQMPVLSLLWYVLEAAHSKDTQVSEAYKDAARELASTVIKFAQSRVHFAFCMFLLVFTLLFVLFLF